MFARSPFALKRAHPSPCSSRLFRRVDTIYDTLDVCHLIKVLVLVNLRADSFSMSAARYDSVSWNLLFCYRSRKFLLSCNRSESFAFLQSAASESTVPRPFASTS